MNDYIWYCPETNELVVNGTCNLEDRIAIVYQDPIVGFTFRYYYYIGEL